MRYRKAGGTGVLLSAVVLWALPGSGLAADGSVPVPDPGALVFDVSGAAEQRSGSGAEPDLSGDRVIARDSLGFGGIQSFTEPPAGEEDLSELTRTAQQYRQSVREMEAQGAWAAGLGQELMGLGRTLQRLGEHEQAIPVFDRAAHVTRVNQGLYTMDQLPALEERVNSHLALGQWEEADQQQQYAFHLYSRAMGQNNPALVEVLRDFAHWNLSVHFRGLEEMSGELFHAYRLFDAAYDLLVEVENGNLERRLTYLDSLVGAAWVLARTHLGGNNPEPVPDGSYNAESMVRLRGQDQPGFQINGFSQGEAALQRAVGLQVRRAEQGRGSLLETAEALSRLADWYLLFDRPQTAMNTYRQIWELLEDNDGVQADEFFDEVQVLPRFTTFPEQRLLAMEEQQPGYIQRGYMDVQLNVTRLGRARNVKVIGGDPVIPEEMESRFNRNVGRMRFRPRMEEGEPVGTEDVVLRLPYWY